MHLRPSLALIFAVGMAFTADSARAQPFAPPSGGGPAPSAESLSDELAPEARVAITRRLDAARAALREQGRLPPAARSVRAPSLSWPLRFASSVGDVHAVTNFVDLQPGADALRDFECGTRTYDQVGYDHAGIDYLLWPFGWELMDANVAEVVAAAPGTLLGTDDGHYDRQCQWEGAGDWNAVYVQHDDGTVAWYGHLQAGSATTKAVGARIERGEVLGRVGSSGRSSAPHLHFEVHDAAGAVVEPHAGTCNAGPSWWQNQRPYYDSKLSAISTHAAPASFASCPGTTDAPRRSDHFDPGDRIYYYSFYRDQRAGQTTTYRIWTPSGALHQSWTHAMDVPHYAASYWYWSSLLPTNAEHGTWTFTATFAGETKTYAFTVGDATPVEPGPDAAFVVGAPVPNPTSRSARLTVALDRPRPVHVDLLDLLGRTVLTVFDGQLTSGTLDLDLRGVPEGTYLVRVRSDDGAIATRVLIRAR